MAGQRTTALVAAGLLGGLTVGAVLALALGPREAPPGPLSPALVVTPTAAIEPVPIGPTPALGSPPADPLPDLVGEPDDDPVQVPQPVQSLDDDYGYGDD